VRPQHGSWEPGASLRAEVRRLRSQQIQLMGIMSQFLEVLGAPEDLLLRLAALLSSLDQHKQLDARNGFHAHNHGDALRAAASELSKEDYERMLGIKKKGDAARHAPFYVQSQPVSDVFQYLEGMCLQQPASVAGGTLWASWSAPCDGCGDSLANAAAAERAVQSQLVDSVKSIIRAEEARPVFEVGGFVIVDPGGCLARVFRIGHSDHSQEVRVASLEEGEEQTAGRWVYKRQCRPLLLPARFSTIQSVSTACARPSAIAAGMLGVLLPFDHDGDLVVRFDAMEGENHLS